MIAGGGAIVAPAPGQPLPALEWKFSQVFGERAAGEEVQEGALYIIFFLIGVLLLLLREFRKVTEEDDAKIWKL